MPLPMPGSPAASWAVYRARVKAIFDGADPRVCAAFWLFGECILLGLHARVFIDVRSLGDHSVKTLTDVPRAALQPSSRHPCCVPLGCETTASRHTYS